MRSKKLGSGRKLPSGLAKRSVGCRIKAHACCGTILAAAPASVKQGRFELRSILVAGVESGGEKVAHGGKSAFPVDPFYSRLDFRYVVCFQYVN